MQFFNREEETHLLINARELSRRVSSQFTVLITITLSDETPIDWFVSRSHEAVLASEFASAASDVLGVAIPRETKSIAAVFELVMQVSQYRPVTLIIDEFQELAQINPALFGKIQDVWDRLKDKTHLHLVVSGSVHSMMKHIFLDRAEPLYGRATQVMPLRPFRTNVLNKHRRNPRAGARGQADEVLMTSRVKAT